MKRFITLLSILAVAGACGTGYLASRPVAVATAALSDVSGRAVGTARLRQEAGGLVHVDLVVAAMPAGTHGVHFHAVGACDASTPVPFESAGAHYNPLNRQHGLQHPGGPHAGDAPNVAVVTGGEGRFSFTTDRITLTSGPVSLMDADGSAIVVHAAADDQTSQPSGNSGSRIACGVIRLSM